MRPVTIGLNNTVLKIPETATEIRIVSSRDAKHMQLSIGEGLQEDETEVLIMKTNWMTRMRMRATNRVAHQRNSPTQKDNESAGAISIPA